MSLKDTYSQEGSGHDLPLDALLPHGQIMRERDAPVDVPRVSVILPLYNCEKYLPKLFAELEAQTLSDYEVICVDDSSTDGTAGTVLRQCTKDERYFAVTIPHGGAGAARNAGLDRAVGKYVIWLDADDDYRPDLLEALVSEADQAAADIAMSLYEEMNYATGVKQVINAFKQDVFTPGTVINPLSVELLYYDYGVRITNKLYRRQFIIQEGLRFSETIVANDVFFNCASVTVAKRVIGVHKCLLTVNRYLNPDSISSRRSEHLEDALAVYRELWAFLEERRLDEKYRKRYCIKVIDDALYNLQYPYNHKYVTGLAALYCTERPWTSHPAEAAGLFSQSHNTREIAYRIMVLKRGIRKGTVDSRFARTEIRFLENRRQALEAVEQIAREKYGKTIYTKTWTYMPKKAVRKLLSVPRAVLRRITQE